MSEQLRRLGPLRLSPVPSPHVLAEVRS
jgi:hypothetical protein